MKNSAIKKIKQQLITASILSTALFTQTQAAPLPNGTLLGIEVSGSGIGHPCGLDSCFGMELAPGFIVWTSVFPGTDGGFIVGKNQGITDNINTDLLTASSQCELAAPWNFLDNYGCFVTEPNAHLNLFDDTSCVGTECIGRTELNSFNVVWNGFRVPIGEGCFSSSCSPEELAGDHITNYTIAGDGQPWSIHYHNVIPDGDPSGFGNVKFQFQARGVAVIPTPTPSPLGSLPSGTLLTIETGNAETGAGAACSVGSCFYLDLTQDFGHLWTAIAPGTDGGLITGKDQEILPSITPLIGELTTSFGFVGQDGVFVTTSPPTDSSLNIFSGSSCVGVDCIGKTELGTWTAAWNGVKTPLGSAGGCTSAFCTPDQQAGIFVSEWTVNPDGSYYLRYDNVVADSDPNGYGGLPFGLILRGHIVLPDTCTEPTGTSIKTIPSSGIVEPGKPITLIGGYSPCDALVSYSWRDEQGAVFSTDATTTKTFSGLPDVHTIELTVTTSLGIPDSVFTEIKVGPPHVNGFWPSAANPGGRVFIFGENFLTASGAFPNVCFDTNCSFLTQVLSDDLMLTIVPTGVTAPTSIPLHVNTDVATGTSLTNWGEISPTISINGIWPAKASAGTIVFVFGSKFDPTLGGTQVTINGVPNFLTQVQDETMLLTILPPGATSGPVCVTAFDDTACGALDLEIMP